MYDYVNNTSLVCGYSLTLYLKIDKRVVFFIISIYLLARIILSSYQQSVFYHVLFFLLILNELKKNLILAL